MKMIKKLTTLCIALFILFTCAMPTMAQEGDTKAGEPIGTIKYHTGNQDVSGVKFNVYRIMKATVAPMVQGNPDGTKPLVAYEIDDKFINFFTDKITAVEGDTDDIKAQVYLAGNVSNGTFHEELKKYIKDNSVVSDRQFEVTGSPTNIENLPYGYYVIIPNSDNFGLTFTTLSAESQEVYLKGVQPGVEKTVSDKKWDSAQIGDEVVFKVESIVPDMTGETEYYYKFTDTMTEGLTFNPDDLGLNITIGDITLTKDEYELYVDRDTFRTIGIEIKNFINYKDKANEKIVFTYKATLNEKAISTNPETNTAFIQYGNDPMNLPVSGPSSATVYTHQLTIKKQDSEALGAIMLAGAKFKLYRGNLTTDEQNLVKFVDNNNGTYRVATAAEITTPGDLKIVDTLVSPDGEPNVKGIIKVTGLDAGEYRLVEIEAPAGYNKLKQPVTINIQTALNQDGQSIDVSGNDPVVVNKAGTLLPETGGMGTVVFTVVGVVGILAVAYSFMPKKSKNK